MNLNYSDKTCLDTDLGIKPANFYGLIDNGYTVSLDTTDYITFGHKSNLSNIDRCYSFYQITQTPPTSGKQVFWVNLISSQDTTKPSMCYYDFSLSKIILLIDNKKYSYSTSIAQDIFSFSISYLNGSAKIKITTKDGVPDVDMTDEGEDTTEIGSVSLIGRYSSSNSVKMKISEVKLYTNNSLVHWYNFAEGSDNYIYDAISTNPVDGILVAASASSSRIKTAYRAYNTVYGFKKDTSEVPISISSIPLDRELVIYKYIYWASISDGWKNGYGSSICSYVDGRIRGIITTVGNNHRIQYTDLRLAGDHVGKQFHIKYKLINSSTSTINKICVTIGSDALANDGFGYTSETNSLVNIAPGSSIEKDFTLEVGNGQDFTPVFQIYCEYNESKALDDIAFDIEYLTITQVNFLTEYPYVPNGKNASESRLNYYYNGNAPELALLGNIFLKVNNTTGPNPSDWRWINEDPTIGAGVGDGWDITSTPTTKVTKGYWQVNANSHVLYCKNHDTTDLPDGVTSAVDLKCKSAFGYASAHNYLYYVSRLTYPFNQIYRYNLKMKLSCWIKINPLITSGNVVIYFGSGYTSYYMCLAQKSNSWFNHEWKKLEVDIDYNSEKPHLSGTYNFGISTSWNGDPTNVDWYVSIADLNVELYPKNDSINPMYLDIDTETNSFKNIKLYQKNFGIYSRIALTGDRYGYLVDISGPDYKRLMNSLKNF